MTRKLLIQMFMRACLLLLIFFAASCGATPEKAKYGAGPFAPNGRSGATWTQGSTSPEGVIVAAPGSFYSRVGGGVGTSLYVKGSGSGATGWLSGPQIDGFYNIVGAPTANHGTVSTGSKNAFGAITTIGAFTSVTLTYSAAYPTDSLCVATPATVTAQEYLAVTAHSASAVTISCINSSTNVAANCNDFVYMCFGR